MDVGRSAVYAGLDWIQHGAENGEADSRRGPNCGACPSTTTRIEPEDRCATTSCATTSRRAKSRQSSRDANPRQSGKAAKQKAQQDQIQSEQARINAEDKALAKESVQATDPPADEAAHEAALPSQVDDINSPDRRWLDIPNVGRRQVGRFLGIEYIILSVEKLSTIDETRADDTFYIVNMVVANRGKQTEEVKADDIILLDEAEREFKISKDGSRVELFATIQALANEEPKAQSLL